MPIINRSHCSAYPSPFDPPSHVISRAPHSGNHPSSPSSSAGTTPSPASTLPPPSPSAWLPRPGINQRKIG
ncbi:MAG: hypothetical protein U1F57_01355 [bacterium]